VSDQKAFAKFPTTGGGYQYVDIFAIEAIGQGGTQELATIFTSGSDRYYLVEVPQAELDRAKEPDAASWTLSLVSKVARAGMAGRFLGEADDEDDFTVPMNDEDDPFGK
jgi:hypothetical protein